MVAAAGPAPGRGPGSAAGPLSAVGRGKVVDPAEAAGPGRPAGPAEAGRGTGSTGRAEACATPPSGPCSTPRRLKISASVPPPTGDPSVTSALPLLPVTCRMTYRH